MQSQLSRRKLFDLLKSSLPFLPFAGIAVSGLAQTAQKAEPAKPAPGTCSPVPANDPVATGLKYVPDGSKVAGRPAKMGVEAKDQSCSTCQLYTKVTDAAGKCVMIASGCVSSKGWCTAWVKKA